MTKRSAHPNLLREHASQQQWIDEHGADLAGYIKRYGESGSGRCYGNGGEAIYNADLDQLYRIERRIARLSA